ncbi:hypothetical protein HPB52_018581 [Rhipicephalus sanguineus]|uniref:Uncharacterized protein n=1 Tax=Rhipicephalus sanguineus TaxID=34632 RepID=A0A9D4PDI3_RHISA|nr:hypothetical protein HPB52_018581 [Rhipicephalus sanguineus]
MSSAGVDVLLVEEFLDILITKMWERLSNHAQSWRPYEDKRRLQKPSEGLRYAYLSNTLVVMQDTTASSLFYSGYARGCVESAPSFGGLATAFLVPYGQSACPVAAAPTVSTAATWKHWNIFSYVAQPSTQTGPPCWTSTADSAFLGAPLRSFSSPSAVVEHIKRALSALLDFITGTALRARLDSTLGGALDIADSHGKTQRYTLDQLFFLTYCRRFCSKQTSCNSAARSLADFGSVFGCAKRRPEEDELSQYRFFASH